MVGIQLDASHLRGVRDGHVTALATPMRLGRTVQVWAIAPSDGGGRAIFAPACTLAVIDAPAAPPASPAE